MSGRQTEDVAVKDLGPGLLGIAMTISDQGRQGSGMVPAVRNTMPQTLQHPSLIEVAGNVLDDLRFDIFAVDAGELRPLVGLRVLQELNESGAVDGQRSIEVGRVPASV